MNAHRFIYLILSPADICIKGKVSHDFRSLLFATFYLMNRLKQFCDLFRFRKYIFSIAKFAIRVIVD